MAFGVLGVLMLLAQTVAVLWFQNADAQADRARDVDFAPPWLAALLTLWLDGLTVLWTAALLCQGSQQI